MTGRMELLCIRWWSHAAHPKTRRVERAVRNNAWLLGPAFLWTSAWDRMPVASITAADVGAWPFSVGLLVKFTHFPGSPHCPRDVGDLGVGGVSFLELLILFESWAGERLVLEKAVPSGRRAGRSISVSAVPVGPGIEMWRPCRFLGCILRFWAGLPGGLCRFLPCCIGAHHCRLRHVGWEKCGHCLTYRPRETSDLGVVE